MFGGRYVNSSTVSTGFGAIYGAKENATSNDLSGYLAFYTNRSGVTTKAMTINSSGNLGLGVTPSAWSSSWKALEIGSGNAIWRVSGQDFRISSNLYNDGSNSIYKANGVAAFYAQSSGQHIWFTAPSGTAGNAITFTQAMTLTANAELFLNTTSSGGYAPTYTTFALGAGSSSGSIIQFQGASASDGAHIRSDRSGATFQSLTIETRGATPLILGTSSTERARINSSGQFGVGTSSPSAIIHSSSSGLGDTGGIKIQNTGSGGATFAIWPTATVNGEGAGKLIISGPSGNAVTLDSSGNLLVGTTSSSFNERIVSQNGSSYTFGSYRTGTGSEGHCIFVNGNGAVGSIFTNASVTLYNTTSDQRLKENIQDSDSSSSLIDSLQVRKFDWKANGSHQRYGFVAQELLTVAPEAVNQPEDTDEMMAVDYSKLVPMLVKEIQSLRKRLANAGI
jgi:hypothetical protein